MAYALRWRARTDSQRVQSDESLSAVEIERAKTRLLRSIQSDHFFPELLRLQDRRDPSENSTLR